jgi:hypothetical protein
LRRGIASLLPPGEGQDEVIEERRLIVSDPLTPALCRREREFVGQQWAMPFFYNVGIVYTFSNDGGHGHQGHHHSHVVWGMMLELNSE